MSVRRMRERQEQGVSTLMMREQSGALGLSGQALTRAIERYRAMAGVRGARKEAMLDEIAQCCRQLMIQREAVGFQTDNLEYIQRQYDLPEEAVARIGASRRR
ncbi:hypothetical protein [Ferrimonas gelatinilytica]|uniref:Uncharacterized protein n=1 Tax=Ferrimonas gelatinilytica TaxID=1255257 RepID=A0ABP9RWP2_9GAMM